MLLAAVAALVAVLFFLLRSPRSGETLRETSRELDAWLRGALEQELADEVLALRGATSHEKKKLRETLANEPDAEIVERIEDAVRAVEVEFVRYTHEADVEVKLRVRYRDGRTGTATRRLPTTDVPEGVRSDFGRKGSTHVFRTWTFPWQRIVAL
jgi:hypothetical protein